jgi:mannose-1-phosphate guanylyltransferase/6-phosphogluconolactonase/glucosamine-6-phosphate isomerase/deaminase
MAGAEPRVMETLPFLPRENIIVAPEDRDTLPTLLLATAHIASRHPTATLLLLASDNYVGDQHEFRAAVERCLCAAQRGPYLVSLGVQPTEASTRFGYMALGEPVGDLFASWFGRGYVEKPPPDVAESLFRGGRHDWNAGIFAWTVASFRAALAAHAREESEIFDALSSTADPTKRAELFCQLRPQAVDTGLLEHVPENGGVVRHVFVRGTFPWDDVGTLDAFGHALPRDDNDNRLSGAVTQSNCKRGLFIAEAPYCIVADGVDDVAVVVADNGDALVADVARLGEVRKVVDTRVVIDASTSASLPAQAVRSVEATNVAVDGHTTSVCGLLGVRDLHVARDGSTVHVRRRAPAPVVAPGRGPRLVVAADETEFSRTGAAIVVETLRPLVAECEGPLYVTFSAGRTPQGIYAELANKHRSSLRWDRVHLIQMDEYEGIGLDDPRSFAHQLRTSLVDPLGLRSTLLDGKTQDAAVIRQTEERVLAAGGIALALHGIGTNGHLGFNETPAWSTSTARRVELASSTRNGLEAHFRAEVPTHGLTLGLRSIAHARRTLVVARGAAKVPALQRGLRTPPGESALSQLTRDHNLTVLVDREAFAAFVSPMAFLERQ